METSLDLLETFNARDAAITKLFGDAADGGFRPTRRSSKGDVAKYNMKLAEATDFLVRIMDGRLPRYVLQETMSRSDFPLLFGDILDRQLLAAYREWPVSWTAVARRGLTPDFRTLQRFFTDGGDEGPDEVPELTEYPETKMNEGRYQVSVKKYGKRIGFSWETLINDDIGFITSAPEALARGARRKESRFVTDLFVGPNGPDAALYTVGNGNIITGNPSLTVAGLTTAIQMLGSMTYQGEPILVDMVTLVVPPALEIIATNILNAATIEVAASGMGGSTGQTMIANNWMRGRVTLDVNPYIPILANSANGTTSWFLFANPSNGRPALEVDFLVGHESPELWQKAPNALRLGGGAADPMDGSYENDSIEYKLRHVFGGGIIDPKMTLASNGTNT